MSNTLNRLTSTGFPEKEFFAIKSFLLNSTVPLIYEKDSAVGIQGTGCLFELNKTLFFVTAGHVLENVDPQALGIPLRQHNKEVFTLGPRIVGWSKQDEFDVAAYRIDDDQVVAQLRKSYTVLNAANVKPDSNTNDHYIIPGYPAETISRNGYELKAKDITQLYTTRYGGDVLGKRTEFDHFFKLRRTAQRLWGNEIEVPDLRGISGAPVWQVRTPKNSIWAPESVLHLIGIQVSCDPKAEKYVRVLDWSIVQRALMKLLNREQNA